MFLFHIDNLILYKKLLKLLLFKNLYQNKKFIQFFSSLILLIQMASSTATSKLLSVDFEVFGKVQGVFFRKYSQQEGTKLKLVGWVMNTEQGTVVGQAQGKEDAIRKMKEWLKKTGSPKSKIEKCEFKSEREIQKLEYSSFDVRK
jgi:acylphosphatase